MEERKQEDRKQEDRNQETREQEASLKNRILIASGVKKAPLVLKGGQVLNVFTRELEQADVAVADGYIVGIGSYEGEEEQDVSGMIVCPGFIDGHIHLESSMVSPAEFERAVLPHGTTAVVTDPHEIANVAGTEGIDYILDATEGLDLDVYVMLPSCVPSADLEESGAELTAEVLRPYYGHKRVLGLAEMMNSFGTLHGEEGIVRKLSEAMTAGKIIDGHAPGISGKELNTYVTAGVVSDHECSVFEEGLEKLKRGQWIMIREGTAAHNLEALLPLCKEPYASRCMFVTDDKHPGDLKRLGHIDGIIRKAVRLGADPVTALLMGSYYPAQYFGLKEQGAVAPGYRADLVLLSDLETIEVKQVYKAGRQAAENGRMLHPHESQVQAYDRVFHSFHMDPLTEKDFRLDCPGSHLRVICLTPGELLTSLEVQSCVRNEDYPPGVDPERDIVKLAVLERHKHTGHKGIGFIKGYGLKRGAVATSVAHDSHNLIAAGVNDRDMAIASEAVRQAGGGIAVAADGQLLGLLPLPIGGLMTGETVEAADEQLEKLKAMARGLGVGADIDPFMTLSFVSLPVIPEVRLNTCGLVNTACQNIMNVSFDPEKEE